MNEELHGNTGGTRAAARVEADEAAARRSFAERGIPLMNKDTLKFNSRAGVPCYNLPNVVHKETE